MIWTIGRILPSPGLKDAMFFKMNTMPHLLYFNMFLVSSSARCTLNSSDLSCKERQPKLEETS